jgi:nitroimidazol reductase NimA-like FMN-containing flavoprotein (pyridoxamine 5'-phosphate oxidase superfamily)
MWETPEDIDRLQDLLDRSLAEAESPQLRFIVTPDLAMTAGEVVEFFRGRKVAALATVNSRGQPYASPVDVFLVRGRFQFGTTKSSLRARHMTRNPAVSLCFYDGDDYAVIVHGTAVAIDTGHPQFEDADRAWIEVYGGSALNLAPDVLYYRIEARRMFTRDAAKRASGGSTA